jgi:hypothetical protein
MQENKSNHGDKDKSSLKKHLEFLLGVPEL